MAYSKDQNRVIGNVFCLINDHLNCTRNWGYYLLTDKYNNDPGLQGKLASIWMSSLLDPIQKEDKTLQKLRGQIAVSNLEFMGRYLDQVSEFYKSIRELLSEFSKEEQLFVANYRDQLVHSFLAGRHESTRKIRYCENGRFHRPNISRDEYEEIQSAFCEGHSPDELMAGIRKRFIDQKYAYWKILSELMINDKLIYQEMRNGHQMQFNSIHL